jgi:hypothetical protein
MLYVKLMLTKEEKSMALLRDTGAGSMTSGDARNNAKNDSPKQKNNRFYSIDGNQFDIEVNPFSESIFDNEMIKDSIIHNEKNSLLDRAANNEFPSSKIRRRGKGVEWQHLVFSLSADETKEMGEMGYTAVADLRNLLGDAFHNNCGTGSHRMLSISDAHDNTDNLHFHIYYHMIPRSPDGSVESVVDVQSTRYQEGLKEWINFQLEDSKFDFLKMNYAHDAEITGAYSQTAVANVSRDFDAGLSNIQNARSLSLETDKLKSGFEFAQREALELQKKADAAKAKVEDFEHLLSAQVQIEDVKKERDQALAKVEISESEKVAAVAEVETAKTETATAIKSQEEMREKFNTMSLQVETLQEIEQKFQASEKELMTMQDAAKTHQKQVDDLKLERTEIYQEFEDVKKENKNLVEENAKAIAVASAAQLKLDAQDNAFSDTVKEVSDLKLKNVTLGQQIVDLKNLVMGNLRGLLKFRKDEGINDTPEFESLIENKKKRASKNNDLPSGPKGP